MEGTFIAIVPTIVAVVFALITKEVFISLFIGIFAGSLLLADGNPVLALKELFETMAKSIGADMAEGSVSQVVGLGNAGIILFMVELGIIVALINKSGATATFGKTITGKIKSEKSALIVTTTLGCAFFMDDCFNRLTVGTIMAPIADRLGITRVRLARIICGVSVSICMLIPVSSWASAISSNIGEGLTEGDPFKLYLSALSCNFYPILFLAFLFLSPIIEINTKVNSVSKSEPNVQTVSNDTGKTIDLILPIAALILISGILMAIPYPSETALVISGAITVFICFLLYIPRKVMSLKEFTACFGSGIKSIAEILIILVFAWTLNGICGRLGVSEFILSLTDKMGSLNNILPAILFLAAMGISFSTGTAWGTFGMLIPLTVPLFKPFSDLQILSIAAVLSGSVFGNQVSPISDSILLTSKVCDCDHLSLIKAQLPDALCIAFISFLGFLISGITFVWLGWLISIVTLGVYIAVTIIIQKRKTKIKAPLPKTTKTQNVR